MSQQSQRPVLSAPASREQGENITIDSVPEQPRENAASAQTRQHQVSQGKFSDGYGRLSSQRPSGSSEHAHYAKEQDVTDMKNAPQPPERSQTPNSLPVGSSGASTRTRTARHHTGTGAIYYVAPEPERSTRSLLKKRPPPSERAPYGQYDYTPRSSQNTEQFRPTDEQLFSQSKHQEDLKRYQGENLALHHQLLAPRAVVDPLQSQSDKQSRSHERFCSQSKTQEDLQWYQQQNLTLQQQLLTTKGKLDSLQSQLDKVQHVTSTADTYSEGEIVQTLQSINEAVYQAASALVDAIDPDVEQSQEREVPPVGQARFSGSISQDLLNHLAAAKENKLELLAFVFQAYLAHRLCRTVFTWTDEQPFDEMIDRIYKRLRETEQQAMSGRWRSLTLSYLSPAWLEDPNDLIQATVRELNDIAVMAGCNRSRSAEDRFLSISKEYLSDIVTLARELRKKVTGMVSCDFEVLAVSPGDAFKEVDMCLVPGIPKSNELADTVLCMTQVGLTRRMPVGRKGEKSTTTIIKAEVLLKSFLSIRQS